MHRPLLSCDFSTNYRLNFLPISAVCFCLPHDPTTGTWQAHSMRQKLTIQCMHRCTFRKLTWSSCPRVQLKLHRPIEIKTFHSSSFTIMSPMTCTFAGPQDNNVIHYSTCLPILPRSIVSAILRPSIQHFRSSSTSTSTSLRT